MKLAILGIEEVLGVTRGVGYVTMHWVERKSCNVVF